MGPQGGLAERENWLNGEVCLHVFPPAGVTANSQLKVLPYILTLGWDQLYPYTADLMCLDSCRSQGLPTPQELWSVTTPLVVPAWEKALKGHPDQAFARYIMDGLSRGFRIGFNRKSPLQSAAVNMSSASLHSGIISDYLKELALGRMLGPFTPDFTAPDLQVNHIGVIPKGHNTGKWRLITDLSFPLGLSVNDGVDPLLCSLSYTTVDHVAEVVVSLGVGALLAKVDIESAYRLIPVQPEDRPLQAMRWGDQMYVDPMLPFGSRSAPKIFNAVADALHWYLCQRGVTSLFHYLDDFNILAPPQSPRCRQDLSPLLQVCAELGIPIASHKTEGTASCLVFLGIEVDTMANELRLPKDKLCHLQTLLEQRATGGPACGGTLSR